MEIRRTTGVIVASFADVEVALIAALLDELDDLIDAMDEDDATTRRLFPAGYRDDEVATADFRELTAASLQQERRDRYGLCRAELPRPAGKVTITPETSERWLVVLNDMRLTLGTRLGVTADGFDHLADDDPDSAARALYHWLTGVQDELLTQLMR